MYLVKFYHLITHEWKISNNSSGIIAWHSRSSITRPHLRTLPLQQQLLILCCIDFLTHFHLLLDSWASPFVYTLAFSMFHLHSFPPLQFSSVTYSAWSSKITSSWPLPANTHPVTFPSPLNFFLTHKTCLSHLYPTYKPFAIIVNNGLLWDAEKQF